MLEFLNNLMIVFFIIGDVLMVTLSIRLVSEIVSEVKEYDRIKDELRRRRIIND